MERPSPAQILQANRERAQRMRKEVGTKRTEALLQSAIADLTKRLGDKKPSADEPFTLVRMQSTLAQLRDVVRTLKLGMGKTLLDAAAIAAETEAQELLRYMEAAEKKYTGIGQPLALNEARITERAVAATESSVLQRIASNADHPGQPGVLDRYGNAVIANIEDELRLRLVTQKPWAEVREAIIGRSGFLQQAPLHWAERIVRTETMAMHGRAALETIAEAQAELPDMVKILSATFDTRTAADSYANHGQIRRPKEAFDTWFGSMMAPPNRPNDREVVVPHRIAWPIPKALEWKSDGDVRARWASEGRKGAPPPRPRMTTVDLDLFGADEVEEPVVEVQAPVVAPPPPPEPKKTVVEVRAPEPEVDPKAADAVLTPIERMRYRELLATPELSPGRIDPHDLIGHHTVSKRAQLAAIESELTTVKRRLEALQAKDRPAFEERFDMQAYTLTHMAMSPEGLSKAEIARAVAKATPAKTPLLVRHEGRVHVVEHGEQLVAQAAVKPDSKVSVRFVDLDKHRPPPPSVDLPTFVARHGAAFTKLGSNPRPAVQRETREALRGVLRSYGIETRDDRRASMLTFAPTVQPLDDEHTMNRLERATPERLGYANAQHDWTGRVTYSEKVGKHAAQAFSLLQTDPNVFANKRRFSMADEDDVDAVRTIVHEELHGTSAATSASYEGVGVGIEEAATEILARHVTRDLLKLSGAPDENILGLPALRDGKYKVAHAQSYDKFVEEVFNSVAEVTGHERLHERVVGALVKTRRWHNQAWQTGRQQIEAIVDAMDLPLEKRNELVERLATPQTSKLNPANR